MKDIEKRIQYKDHNYRMTFNLNVMEEIQREYGTIDKWASLTEGEIDENGKAIGEPDAKAVILGFTAMINEGIDIDNEENGTNNPFLTNRQVGRIITEVGMQNATSIMTDTVIESSQSSEKNA